MLTVTQLAKKFAISRSTILYYEREGLLVPASRTQSGYRLYGQAEVEKLSNIISYRSFGVSVQAIIPLVNNPNEQVREQTLRTQFASLDKEVQKLRKQQTAIVAVLQDANLVDNGQLTKQRWTEIMEASGFNETDMSSWHSQFEKMEPQGHHQFLISLGIDNDEINAIRQYCNELLSLE